MEVPKNENAGNRKLWKRKGQKATHKMGKLFCIMGKSASGKDSIYEKLLAQREFPLSHVVPYTTRPIRSGEEDGVSYHFLTEQQLRELEAAGKVIECRTYQTIHGPWNYFTVDDGQIDLTNKNAALIVTLEGYRSMRAFFGEENIVPIYIEVEDGERLSRALSRERAQEHPKYEEMCRRFLADQEDFSEEHLKDCQITKRFENISMEKTIEDILKYMKTC